MKVFGNKETSNSPALFTQYSIVHFLSGVWAYTIIRWALPSFSLFDAFWIWFVIHGLYEVKDITRSNGRNSIVNSFGDTIAGLTGFAIAYYIFSMPIRLADIANTSLIILLAVIAINEDDS